MEKNLRKSKRLKGNSYRDTNGNRVAARHVKPSDCEARSCRLKCSTKVSDEQRQQVFDQFYQLGSWEAQTAYIVQSILEYPVSRHTAQDENYKKTPTRAHYLKLTDEDSTNSVRVCRNMFINTLNINSARVHYALQHKRTDKSDRRGRHESRKTLSDVIKNKVENIFQNFHVMYRITAEAALQKNM
jgi:hypothetical protein